MSELIQTLMSHPPVFALVAFLSTWTVGMSGFLVYETIAGWVAAMRYRRYERLLRGRAR